MSPHPLNYESQKTNAEFYLGNAILTLPVVTLITAVNFILVHMADRSWGFFGWVFGIIPATNLILGLFLLALCPLVRALTGWSAALHVCVTVIGCILAVMIDAAIILSQLHGC